MMKTKLLFALILFFCFSLAHASPGSDLLSAAEDFIAIAEFDKALVFTDKAISQLESSGQEPGTAARAHFVKAYILAATGKDEAAVKDALSSGLTWDAGASLPQEYAGHPLVKKLFAEVQQSPAGDPCENVAAAQKLFEQSDFCGAYAKLCPTQGQCAAQSMVESMIAKVSLDNCPSYQGLAACPGQAKGSGPGPVRGPGNDPTGSRRIGIGPMIIKDRSGEIQKYAGGNQLSDTLAPMLSGYKVVPLDLGMLDSWTTGAGLKSGYAKYIISEHQIGLSLSIDDLSREGGAKKAATVGGVPHEYAMALQEFMQQNNLEYVLFAKAQEGNRIKLHFVLYSYADTFRPALSEIWKNISKPKHMKKWMLKIPNAILPKMM